jgi:hypothetical protein
LETRESPTLLQIGGHLGWAEAEHSHVFEKYWDYLEGPEGHPEFGASAESLLLEELVDFEGRR